MGDVQPSVAYVQRNGRPNVDFFVAADDDDDEDVGDDDLVDENKELAAAADAAAADEMRDDVLAADMLELRLSPKNLDLPLIFLLLLSLS